MAFDPDEFIATYRPQKKTKNEEAAPFDPDAWIAANSPKKKAQNLAAEQLKMAGSDIGQGNIVDALLRIGMGPAIADPVKEKGGGLLGAARAVSDSPARQFAQGVTAGLSEPAAAGISALINEALQLTGSLPERAIGDVYQENIAKQREQLAQIAERSPEMATAANIAGMISPGSVFSRAMAGAPKALPFLQKGFLGTAGSAGIANLLSQGLEDISAGKELTPKKSLEDFLWASIPVAGIGGLAKGARASAPKIRGFVDRAKDLPEGMLPKQFETIRKLFGKAPFAERAEQELVKRGISEAGDVGEKFAIGVRGAAKDLSQSYKSQVKPFLSKARDVEVETKGLQRGIKKILKDSGALDEAGQVSKEQLKLIPKKARSALKELENVRSGLGDKTTISKLENIKKSFGEAKRGAKGVQRTLYGKIEGEVRQELNKQLGKALPKRDVVKYQESIKKYALRKPSIDAFKKMFELRPDAPLAVEKIPQKLKNMGLRTVNEYVGRNPTLRKPVREAILFDLVKSAQRPDQVLTKIDRYGPAQVKKLLGKDYQIIDDLIKGDKGSIRKLVDLADKMVSGTITGTGRAAEKLSTKAGPLTSPFKNGGK